ncbi:hypothetical protein C5167_042804 [Papaver somniferum]|uniref:CRIB domain-containing protein n=1 Tax=Papaver somniferum TaxID=3469 RepID=A0A4Y7L760_PAPSO|nr:CRIB domain-containing protein RIC5-like [Papaver somniferum]RZC80221.1 hypothetical protein C5167_042804 [Papaver somniferum]
MTTKMKGLLKGLRYISQIFEKEDEEEEEEMQIGFPTDVKHVAHIGWDGPAVSSPSWMNEFKGTPEPASNPLNPVKQKERSASKSPSQDYSTSGDSSARNGPDLPKPSRRRNSKSDASSFDSSTQEGSVPKQSSRRQKSNSGDSSASSQDPTTIPKQTKKKKSKGSSGDGSTKMRSKDSDINTNETYPPIGFE